MQQEQGDFDLKVNEISTKVTAFCNFNKMEDYEEVATQAREIKAKMDAAQETAKMYNNREILTG